jgi:hypothetical protein
MKRMLWILVALLTVALVGAVFAQSGKEEFKAKWKRLTKDPDKVFKVTAKPGEEIPEATLDLSFGPGSLVSVSRGGSSKRDMLEEQDIVAVVNRNLRSVKFCYCKALKKDPEFEGEALVEMKIQTSGKVSNVDIQPEDMAEHHFGKCLGPRVAKWRFPKFSGKKEDGLKVKSIGYEFPLEFNQAQ